VSLPKLIAVVGPTASGKTALGEAICLKFGGEIISADAKQQYRGMDLGTAKDTNLKVTQYLIDTKNPGEVSTVAEYQQAAYTCIDACISKGKLPVLVGGSMLYAEAVISGYTFAKSDTQQIRKPHYNVLSLGIAWDREALKAHAKERLKERIDAGMVEEVEKLLANGVSEQWLLACGLEYKALTQHIRGELSIDEAFDQIVRETNQYIKRQYTWWRHHGNVAWVNGTSEAFDLVEQFLKGDGVREQVAAS
jgi:tRNA dimethylallyltransferase